MILQYVATILPVYYFVLYASSSIDALSHDRSDTQRVATFGFQRDSHRTLQYAWPFYITKVNFHMLRQKALVLHRQNVKRQEFVGVELTNIRR
jgi:hypothetical protein